MAFRSKGTLGAERGCLQVSSRKLALEQPVNCEKKIVSYFGQISDGRLQVNSFLLYIRNFNLKISILSHPDAKCYYYVHIVFVFLFTHSIRP